MSGLFRRRALPLWMLCLATGLAGCASTPQRAATVNVADSGGAFRMAQPHAAVEPDGDVLVVWGMVSPEGTADIALARLDRNGQLGEARRVNRIPGSAVAGRQVGPRISLLPSGRILVSWVDRARDPAGDIVVAYSDDSGESFSAPILVNDDQRSAGQEYHDVAVLPDGEVMVVWLDERDAPADYPNQKQLYSSRSSRGGRVFAANRRVTHVASGVCPCCRPSLAAQPDGTAHLVYRARERDELVVRLRRAPPGQDFGTSLDVPGARWRYSACPVDGPSVVATATGSVVVAWMDGAMQSERLWVVRSPDGREFEARQELAVPTGEAAARRASLALDEQMGAVAAWEDTHGRIWIRRLWDGSARDGVAGPATLLGGDRHSFEASSVALTAGAGQVHAFWIEENAAALFGGMPDEESTMLSKLCYARVVTEPGADHALRVLRPGGGSLLAGDGRESARGAD